MKTKTIPFDLETAKKIQAGEIEGRIVAENIKGILFPIRIICYDAKNMFPIVGLALDPSGNEYIIRFGKSGTNLDDISIHIELPEEEAPQTFHTEFPKGHAVLHGNTIICVKEETPKHEFKPFDKVLVRDFNKSEWRPRLYSCKGNLGYCTQDGFEYTQILPYEGNEHLVGTTDKPKEE